MSRTELRGPLAAAGIALAFAAVLFARGHPYDQDQIALALPYARIFRDAVREHRFPLWTNLIWCGYPVHAEGQGGFLAFPFRLVAALAPDEVLGLELETTLALVLAALAGAFAARLLGRSHPAAATAGVIWALGGGLLSYQENPAVLEACWAWPLVLALGQRGGRGAAVVGGALLGLGMLAGWPYGLALLLPPLLFTWRWRELAVALLLGVLIGAAQWVPTAELLLHSERASGLRTEEVLRSALGPSDLVRLVSPAIPLGERAGERSVVFAYVGLPALALAALGARRKQVFFSALLLVSLLLAVLPSIAPGAAELLARVPPFSFARGPSKLLLVFGLAASFLAAEGVDALPRRAWLAFAIVALDLFQFGQRRALIVEREVLRTAPEIARALPPGVRAHAYEQRPLRWFPELDATSFRAASMLDPDENVLAGVPTIQGYGPLAVARSWRLAHEPNLVHLARAGAEYLVAPRGWPPRGLELVSSFATVRLYRLPPPEPLVRFATEAVVASGTDAMGVEDKAFELAGRLAPSVAVLEESLPFEIDDGEAKVQLFADDEVVADVAAKGDALFVVAITRFPGWRATVDGVAAPIMSADYAFMAVPVPRGAKRVDLVYRPDSFRLGLALSASGVLVVLLLAGARRGAAGTGGSAPSP